MCNKKDDDNRTFEEESFDLSKPLDELPEEVSDLLKPLEKFLDFYYNKPWRVILYTFLGSLAFLIISMLTKNRGGALVIVTYPTSLLFYVISLDIKKNMSERFASHNPIGFVILLWAVPIFLFILSLLGAEF